MDKLIMIQNILLYILFIGLVIGVIYSYFIYFLLIFKKYKKGFSIFFTINDQKLFKKLIDDEPRRDRKKLYILIRKCYIYLVITLFILMIIHLFVALKVNKII